MSEMELGNPIPVDYEKKHKEEVVRATQLWECGDITRENLEYIFPELKESDDERIRKALICGMNALKDQKKETFAAIPIDDCITWLEKQDEQKSIFDFNANNWYVSKVDGKIHNIYNVGVEPKFKNGQWIVFNGLTLYVKEVVKGFYRTITIDGIPNSYDGDIDNIARLWTIEDAKDGDVLYSLDSKRPFIYKDRLQFSQARGYCCINKFGEFAVWYTSKCVICTDKYIPATKEQRDLLFQKMKEAGYEWVAEKKELRKIEKQAPKSKWTEEDVEIVSKLQCTLNHVDYDYDTHKKLDNWLKSIEQRMEE